MARSRNPWPARIAALAALAALLLAGYLVAGTVIAHRILAATLTVGQTQLSPPPPEVPADPLAIGYVRDPETAASPTSPWTSRPSSVPRRHG